MSEFIVILFLIFHRYFVIKWRAKSLKGDIDILCFDGKKLVLVEVKTSQHDKQIFEILRAKQRRILRKRAKSVALSLQLFPEKARFDLILVDWSKIIPRLLWFQELEILELFPVSGESTIR
ncbi:MAG: YraN family protein [Deltaproteobacteria bacterium]|nr:YraN family protein [Deltaproteobacteria bacterium]